MREVELPFDLQLLLLLAREDAVEQLLRVLGSERREFVQALHFSTHANDRRRPHRDVQVGGVARHHVLQELID